MNENEIFDGKVDPLFYGDLLCAVKFLIRLQDALHGRVLPSTHSQPQAELATIPGSCPLYLLNSITTQTHRGQIQIAL